MRTFELTEEESVLLTHALGLALGVSSRDGDPRLFNALLRLANSVHKKQSRVDTLRGQRHDRGADDEGREVVDKFSAVHFNTVWAEIQGRFFSQEEADQLKELIDRSTVTDPQIRTEAAKCWET